MELDKPMTKPREDFVWIRPGQGCGSVQLDLAGRRVTITRQEPAEALKSLWLGELAHLGSLELCEAPKSTGGHRPPATEKLEV